MPWGCSRIFPIDLGSDEANVVTEIHGRNRSVQCSSEAELARPCFVGA